MPVIDAIGSAFGEFSKGYLQGRMLQSQQALQAHTQNLEDIRTLSEAADKFKDNPQLQEQYLGQLHDALDRMPKPPKPGTSSTSAGGSSQTGGIKGFFSNMFGMSKKNPQAPAGTDPMSLMPEADKQSTGVPDAPAGPPAVSPGSQTFGALPGLMTPPVAPPVGAAATGPTMAPPPSPGAAAQPAGFLPSPSDIAQEAKQNWWKMPGTGFTQKPQFVGGNPQREQAYSTSVAYAHAHTALNAVDQHIENYNQAHPEAPIKTEADIYANPEIAPEYKHVADTVRAYEADHLIPANGTNGEKGTLDSWRQQFEDVRPGYDKLQADRLKVERILSKPESLRTDSEKGMVTGWKSRLQAEEDAKMSPDQAEQKRVNDAYLTIAQHPQMAARPETFASATEPVVQRTLSNVRDANDTVTAYQNKLRATERGKMNPDQQLQSDWMTAYDQQNPKATVDQKANAFVSRFHPPQPVAPQVVPGISPGQGTATFKILNRNTGKFEDTNIAVDKEHPFVPSRFEKEVTVQVPTGIKRPNGDAIMEPQKVKGFDVDALTAAHASKDPSVTLDTLSTLLNNGAAFTPEDRQKLSNYIKSKANPF